MSTQDRSIVVGVDGSAPSNAAIQWAAAEAALREHPLHLVHVYIWPAVAASFVAPSYGWTEATAREQADAIVKEAVEMARAAAPGVPVTGQSVYGPIAQTLVELSQSAAMLVVGDRGHGGFASLLLGSVASAAAAHASSPVAVVRSTGGEGGIVVGVDGSPSAEAALAFAFDEAHRRATTVHIVHSWDPPAPPRRAVDPLVLDVAEFETAEAHAVREWARPWLEKYPDVDNQFHLTAARPAAALIDAAADATLVVVGSRGRGGFTGLVLGSVSQQVIHHCPAPVVVAR